MAWNFKNNAGVVVFYFYYLSDNALIACESGINNMILKKSWVCYWQTVMADLSYTHHTNDKIPWYEKSTSHYDRTEQPGTKRRNGTDDDDVISAGHTDGHKTGDSDDLNEPLILIARYIYTTTTIRPLTLLVGFLF